MDRMRLLIVPLIFIAACGSEPVGVVDAVDSPQGGVCATGFDQPNEDGSCVFRGYTFDIDERGTRCAIGSYFSLVWASDGETVVFGLHKPDAYESPARTWLFAADVVDDDTARLHTWVSLDAPDDIRSIEPAGVADLMVRRTQPPLGWLRFRLAFPSAPFAIKGCAVDFFAYVSPSDPAQFERFDPVDAPETAELQAAARELLARNR